MVFKVPSDPNHSMVFVCIFPASHPQSFPSYTQICSRFCPTADSIDTRLPNQSSSLGSNGNPLLPGPCNQWEAVTSGLLWIGSRLTANGLLIVAWVIPASPQWTLPLLLGAARPCGSGSNPLSDRVLSGWGECCAHEQLARCRGHCWGSRMLR